jgi:hypothetical protein
MGHVLMSPNIKIEILGSQWSQSPCTQQAPIVFVWGWGDFLILVFPMCSIWLAQPIPSSFELLYIMFPIYSSSSQCISHSTILSFFQVFFSIFLIAQMKKFIAKQSQYKIKGKAKGNSQPAQPRNTLQHSTTLLTHNFCPRFYGNLYT